MRTSKAVFAGHSGAALAARLDLPRQPPRAFALFAHCFTCSKDVLAASRISAGLVQAGLGVMRFDFTGLGMSEGEFANTNFSSNVADLVLAADHLRRHHEAPALLVGHSLGGAAVLAAAAEIPEVKAVATIGAPSEPVHVTRHFADRVDAIRAEGAAEVELAGRTFTLTRQFLDDIEATRLRERIAGLGRALLVMHAPQDELVDVDHARRIFAAAQHPKSFVALDGADHLLRRREDAAYAAAVLAAWAGRYLPPPEATALEAGVVEVEETGGGRFTSTVREGGHTLLADEPTALGGDDAGPSPYGYLLAGLGACTAMTIRMYASRKNLPLTGVRVRLRQQRVHAEDCVDCERKMAQITEISREIYLEGALDEAQRQRLLEIAEKCPVHRTLTSTIRITSRLG